MTITDVASEQALSMYRHHQRTICGAKQTVVVKHPKPIHTLALPVGCITATLDQKRLGHAAPAEQHRHMDSALVARGVNTVSTKQREPYHATRSNDSL